MEVDEIQTPQQTRKFSRVTSNGTTNVEQSSPANTSSELVALSSNRLRQWPHSSRIIRVSRASGGKDRHSKVWTARGPRDRRVRLSVNTAIQFYDLQDRLGYEQPSKAVEWLIKAADDAINELPSLDRCLTFPSETPRQLSVDRQEESPDPNLDLGPQNQQQMSRSGGCNSNNSENSKGSGGLSLSRSEIRVKARERARERTAKEKVRDDEPTTRVVVQGQQLNVGSNHTSSFTQLLTSGISSREVRGSGAITNHWLSPPSTTAMDYFGNSIHSNSESHSMSIHDHHSQLLSHHQHFPFLSDHHHQQQQNLIHQLPVTSGGGGNIYNFNFSISPSSTTSSSGLVAAAGFNSRGTLQSNSPSSLLPYLQRFNSNNTTTDGSNSSNVSVPFFLGGAAISSTEETHHHQFQPPGLQLYYGDSPRQGDHNKGKSKDQN